MRLRSRWVMAPAVLAIALLAGPVLAAEPETEEEGIPAYSVARLKISNGSAWVRPPDSGEWEEFSHNSPIAERSRVSVPEGSEAELQFHGGQYLLLTGGSEVDVRELGESKSAFRARAGLIKLSLPEADFAPVRVWGAEKRYAEFPVPGRYWIAAEETGDTVLTVRAGEASVVLDGRESRVRAGEVATIGRDIRIARYEEGGKDYDVSPPPMTEEETKAGVPPAAASELRDYGEWVYTPDYGYVWKPWVGSDWSPYYYGRWAWVSPYGWTWVANEPWGWYPYHYGYWFTDPAFGWVWSPFHTFVSVGFVFGHNHFFHFHRDAHFFPARVRFHRDDRFIRWVPLRPGERFTRTPFVRSDGRLARWNRPLDRGTVFARGDGGRRVEVQGRSVVPRSERSVITRGSDGGRTGRGGGAIAAPRERGGGGDRTFRGRDGIPAGRGGGGGPRMERRNERGSGGPSISSDRAPAARGGGDRGRSNAGEFRRPSAEHRGFRTAPVQPSVRGPAFRGSGDRGGSFDRGGFINRGSLGGNAGGRFESRSGGGGGFRGGGGEVRGGGGGFRGGGGGRGR